MNTDGFVRSRLQKNTAVVGSLGEPWERRAKLKTILGGFDEAIPEPNPELWESTVEADCTRHRLRFQVREGHMASGYFLEPRNAPPGPAVLCLPGHGQGVDAIVGLADEPYQADFAIQCVRRGYRVLALEMIGFGSRASSRVRESGWSCEADSKAALMAGETMLGWRVWDAMRAIDVLADWPGVDANRIAIMGISGGGTVALWTAALDERVAAAVLSGSFSTFEDSILAIDHCLDNFVPGVLKVLDMPDLASLIAPRPLFVENGADDPIFPIAGFKKAVLRAEAIYEAAGASSNFGFEILPGGHEFDGQEAFEFLAGKLA